MLIPAGMIAHKAWLFCLGAIPVFGNFALKAAAAAAAAAAEAAEAFVQAAFVMVLWSKLTAPLRARTRPFRLAPVVIVMDVSATTLPFSEVFVPKVAELGTCHQTLHGSPPTILAVPEVTSVAADLKTHTPDPARVSVPVNVKVSAQ